MWHAFILVLAKDTKNTSVLSTYFPSVRAEQGTRCAIHRGVVEINDKQPLLYGLLHSSWRRL